MVYIYDTRQASADSFLIRCSLRNLSRVTECIYEERIGRGLPSGNQARDATAEHAHAKRLLVVNLVSILLIYKYSLLHLSIIIYENEQ